MKIGVSSYSFNRYLKERKGDYADILKIAKEIGFDGVEFIDLVNESWGQTGDAINMAKEIKKQPKSSVLRSPHTRSVPTFSQAIPSSRSRSFSTPLTLQRLLEPGFCVTTPHFP